MRIIIKGRKKFRVSRDLQLYIEEKFGKFEKLLKEPTILEVMLADVRGPQGGVDKVVHLTASLPGFKNPEQIEEVTEDFRQSIDLVQERFEKFVLRYKEKIKIGSRYPKKYWVAKKMEEENREI